MKMTIVLNHSKLLGFRLNDKGTSSRTGQKTGIKAGVKAGIKLGAKRGQKT